MNFLRRRPRREGTARARREQKPGPRKRVRGDGSDTRVTAAHGLQLKEERLPSLGSGLEQRVPLNSILPSLTSETTLPAPAVPCCQLQPS